MSLRGRLIRREAPLQWNATRWWSSPLPCEKKALKRTPFKKMAPLKKLLEKKKALEEDSLRKPLVEEDVANSK